VVNLSHTLNKLYSDHPNIEKFIARLNQNDNIKIHLKGLTGSSRSLFSARFLMETGRIILFILDNKEEAAYFYNDLTNILGKDSINFFPSSYKRLIHHEQMDSSNIILRYEVLNKIKSTSENKFFISYPEALIEKVIPKHELKKNTFDIGIHERITIDFLEENLRKFNFEKVDFVFDPGQYSIRGGIVDIFSFSNEHPYRIDFFGNEIDSIRSFNVENQLSIERFEKISILPNIQDPNLEVRKESFLKFLPKDSVIWTNNITLVVDKINHVFKSAFHSTEENDGKVINKEKNLISGEELLEQLIFFRVIESGQQAFFKPDLQIQFRTSPQPAFNKNFDLLLKNLAENTSYGYTNYILSDNQNQFDRLNAIFRDISEAVQYIPIGTILHEGFIDHDLKFCCYTDHQIFDRYHRYELRGNFSKKDTITIRKLTDLKPGDYVVHTDHGIGQFAGLEKIEINEKIQEAIKLVYKDNDTLYVKIHALHRISKYKSGDSKPPKIYKLGSGAWQKLKLTTKSKIKDIAKDLITLYAKRKSQKGFAYTADSYLQKELEASFIYEDTPDQLEATKAVKDGMEALFPMDRLVCGDVGFGKTEVAVRAAFKAVADSKQVAILVPTTILALQHFNTFTERLKDFPCNIDYISRLKRPKDQKKSIRDLSNGKTDIIIGTHRLVSGDIQFRDLGLLIVDEEQKFGVAVKEKLKKLKLNVDSLTLTATPIPRTMQFSLMGARDFSIINTPPPNRYPIVTELHHFNQEIIKEGINYEVNRNGQVFFIHNRVENILEIETLINRICPHVKTVVAHGQMEGRKLETVMLNFIGGEYDVLIATSIIESGLDIPNTNTIFINNAHHFGLSDLHQLRGRVGRSNKKAFCYLMTPPLSLLTPEARKRLKAIEEFSELGSGFNIAMHDLDIRGAGNLLGAEQSGFIADIGFETYHRILDEAVMELKEKEFRELFSNEKSRDKIDNQIRKELGKIKFVKDCFIDTDLELMFPDNYILNITERLRLYRELDNIQDEESLLKFERDLIDRFGPLPDPAKELLNIVRLRWLAIDLGFEKIFMKNKKMILHFVSDPESPYFNSPVFSNILDFIQKHPHLFQIKESKQKLSLIASAVSGLHSAIDLLRKIREHSIKD
jgi:transcription-repair coupling factor (superfamily II helicase)